MKETLIIAIILGAFALLASLRAARLDAANAAKPRRNGRTGGKESAGKGAEQGRLRPTILRTAAVGMAVLAIGITLTTWLLLHAGENHSFNLILISQYSLNRQHDTGQFTAGSYLCQRP